MSTELLEGENGIYFTRFCGGKKRGVCYQIAVKNDHEEFLYLQFTDKQMAEVLAAWVKSKAGV